MAKRIAGQTDRQTDLIFLLVGQIHADIYTFRSYLDPGNGKRTLGPTFKTSIHNTLDPGNRKTHITFTIHMFTKLTSLVHM